MSDDADGDELGDGPVLYLDPGHLESEQFCTATLDGAAPGEYRVVQLTATQSFDSLRDSLTHQLERVNDPSEAAVIITAPHGDTDTATATVGEETPLFGFWVDPQDLTGISVAFSRLIQRWEHSEGSVRICLRDVESLVPYHDADLLYRFLNTVLATLRGAGADVHVHLDPAAVDEKTRHMFESLFAAVVDGGEDATGRPSTPGEAAGVAGKAGGAVAEGETGAAAGTDRAEGVEAAGETGVPDLDGDELGPATMTDQEMDAFLASEGYGTLAFAGEPAYAIPMSFGFDAAEGVAYMQMGRFEGSEKMARVSDSRSVSLVVQRYRDPDRWRSVVVDGTLRELSEDEVDEEGVLETFSAGDLAAITVFERDPGSVSFQWYVLEPTSITGRRSMRSL